MTKYYYVYNTHGMHGKRLLRLFSFGLLSLGVGILVYVLIPLVNWQLYFLSAFASGCRTLRIFRLALHIHRGVSASRPARPSHGVLRDLGASINVVGAALRGTDHSWLRISGLLPLHHRGRAHSAARDAQDPCAVRCP